MTTKDDGGPAFPNVPDGAGDKWADWDKGMTLRDYFAAKAMAALMVTPMSDWPSDTESGEYITRTAYELADAMLAARGAA